MFTVVAFVLLVFFGGGGVFARKFGWTRTTMGVCISKVSPSDNDRDCRARLLTFRLALGAASVIVFGLFLTPPGLPRGR